MKLYFLVEGISSEMKVYPQWVKLFLPEMPIHQKYSDFKHADSGIFFVSGEGYPSIHTHLRNSIDDINNSDDIDYFFVILDCDESSVEIREQEIKSIVLNHPLPQNTDLTIIIQKRCFETILLANSTAIPHQPTTDPVIDFMRYYDVHNNNPELMGNYKPEFTHSQFHAKYAIHALREKRVRYSKSNCSDVANPDYFQKIITKINNKNHMQSVKPLIDKLAYIQGLIS